ncbi:mannitol dehydrogenase family protein [Georgenia sp. Z1344]|uniref:mannitol dehydrogenase family protein n=1 Tax=Georgenia sp. Z1344 TaxID=3416706 RepID=UPI003CFAD2C6
MSARLSRGPEHPAAPVRLVHVGLGNFFRAHQAWYTHHSPDSADWGYAAFTGRSPAAAEALAPQGGRYTLVTRGPDGDELEVIDSVVAVHAADDHDAWLGYLRDPDVAVVTLTVTEAGYLRGPDGGLDLAHEGVAADVEALRADPTASVGTAPGRLAAGLIARRAAGAGPITLLSCDNLPGNGEVLRRVVTDLLAALGADPSVAEGVDFAASMVDRITPAATDDDAALVERELGVVDASPVTTEPFSEWVVAGTFPAGRPRWEDAGATIVDDVEPYERRKLLLLNGAHSLMAYAGPVLGHETVDQAFGDPQVRAWVEELWDDASETLDLPSDELDAYRAALRDRFANPRMRDSLARIAMDGSQKLPVRHVPVLRSAREVGRLPGGAVLAVAAWITHLRGCGVPVNDVHGDRWRELAAGPAGEAVAHVLGELVPDLAGDDELQAAVARELEALEAPGGPGDTSAGRGTTPWE